MDSAAGRAKTLLSEDSPLCGVMELSVSVRCVKFLRRFDCKTVGNLTEKGAFQRHV